MKEKVGEVKSEVMGTIATLITTAFGLIAALAWNEAIKAIIARAISTKPPVQDVRIVE